MDALAAFSDAIVGAGLPAPTSIIADGNLHRFSATGKRSDDSGWYVLHLDGIAAGVFGDWRTGLVQKWRAGRGQKLTAAERRAYRQKVRDMKRQREAETQRRHAEAALQAVEIFKQLPPAPADHPYFKSKGITAKVRVDEDVLVIPMLDPDGKLASLQFIGPDGDKKFLPGGRVTGCYFPIGTATDVLYIAEGLATGASIHAATGQAVAVAFNAGNMKPVAEAMRARHPSLQLILVADNDVRTDGTENTGIVKATEAAAVVGGQVAVPELDGKKCDFNDVHNTAGLDAVRDMLDTATEAEPVATPTTDNDSLVAELAALGPIQYGQRRKEVAKQLGVSVGSIDEAVRQARRESAEAESKLNLLFPDIEPCTDTVDGGELLTEIAGEIRRYVVLSEHADTAAALWVLHTYAIEAAYIAPILCVQSPQKRCGKTQLLKLLAAMVYHGLLTENFSLAALYRVMDEYRPTLFIDEADAFLDQQEEIRGIINSGHSRGGRTLRVGGENRDQVEVFDSFGPKAIAGIGKRKDTIADRSIVIELARRRKDEPVESLRLDRLDYRHLQARCAGWAAQNLVDLKAADPTVPPILHDRAADNWRPLLAIAELCGWQARAVKAAMALTETDNSETVGSLALADIRQMFTETDRLASSDIVESMAKMDDRPWPEWGRSQKPITQRQLARLLEPFKVKPKKIRFGTTTANGYALDQFVDVFSRYISDFSSGTPEQMNGGGGFSPFLSGTQENHVPDRSGTGTSRVPDQNSLKANGGADCSGVPDRNPKKDAEEKRDGDNDELVYRI